MPNGTRETYESLNLEPKPIKPHILAAATVVFGDDFYHGQRETISLSGFVQLNKWPMQPFKHRVDDRGYAEFELELISAPEVGIKGFSYMLNDRLQVLSNPFLPNTGHVRQIVPGQNFPAEFFIRRFGVLETSTMRLAHRNVINIEGVIDAVPPWKEPLSAPLLGTPRGDDGAYVVPAPNVVRGINLPEAWYPANEFNQPVGITPKVFFAPTMGPCMSMLVDPSMIIQSTVTGQVSVEVAGQTEHIEISGEHKLAAGAEILLFAPDKHAKGAGIQAQLARLALVGQSKALGGRIMLRASFFRVSGGGLGEGTEESLKSVSYPSELQFDTSFEIVTPNGVLYADTPMHLSGQLQNLDASGTELKTAGPDSVLVTDRGEAKGRLRGVQMRLGDATVGTEAYVTLGTAVV
jgi:uncharacterized protein DUF6004